ncbi:MAG: hypothetical protein IKG97_06355 [Lachnospiraceae bacterium]|nr:hypothetical protein [Lachnospiraceae bacterium]
MPDTTGTERRFYSLAGTFTVTARDGARYRLKVPGTLDESNIGHADDPALLDAPLPHPDAIVTAFDRVLTDEDDFTAPSEPEPPVKAPILTRYTRKYSFRGPVLFSRTVDYMESAEKRLFLEVERARVLRLFVDGREVLHHGAETLVTPHVFEVTGRLFGGRRVSFLSDNRFPGLPAYEILPGNMASDDTQTNWNGLLGYVRLREENNFFTENVRVFTDHYSVRDGGSLSARIEINAEFPAELVMRLTSPALTAPVIRKVMLTEGVNRIAIDRLSLRAGLRLWDEWDGALQEFTVELSNGDVKTVRFGIRTLGISEGHKFTLNGRPLFLRGESSEAVHPDTGWLPTDKSAWEKIFRAYKSYGVNFVRFVTHCPPEAAFEAADEAGILLMPELSGVQGPESYQSERSRAYFRREALEILRVYGHHPSFAFLSFGDGFTEPLGAHPFQSTLLSELRDQAPGLLISPGANVISADFDFVMSGHPEELPPFVTKPVLAVDQGHFEMLPDFSEIDMLTGALSPDNLLAMRDAVEEKGLMGVWQKYVASSGETAVRRYRELIEKHYLDLRIAGIALSGLQDMPGRNTPPEGVMNACYVPKRFDFADPKLFSNFYGPVVLLAGFEKYAYSYGETLKLPLYVMNYGRKPLNYPFRATLSHGDLRIDRTFDRRTVAPGRIRKIGELNVLLEAGPEERTAREMTLTLRFGAYESEYPVCVYPSRVPVCPENVLECEELDDIAAAYLREGGNVFITPRVPSETTEGNRFVDGSHPIFRSYLTENYSGLNWRNIPGKAAFRLPQGFRSIVRLLRQPLDDAPYAQLFEARVLNGAVLVSSLGLKEQILHPEAAALLSCMYRYMGSYEFSPVPELSLRELREILKEASLGI